MVTEGPLALKVPWAEAVEALATRGWARAPEAIDASLAARLAEDDGRDWRVSGDEGVVRQYVIASYRPYLETSPLVRAVGDRLVAGLSAGADRQGLPSVPPFNETTWGRYPAGRGGITAHRDPPAYGGVVAVFTLSGRARFRVWTTGDEVDEWQTAPGQLVLLRGAGWPAPADQCPRHEADPPAQDERLIMTLRHNLSGPGAGYTV